MSISAPFIRRPIATALLMVAIVLLGAIAYKLLPVAALPNVSFPTITVTAQYPGADPQTMASSVATPLEKQFGQIPYLTQMTSTSSMGYTQITLQFALSDNINAAAQLVQTAINAAAGQLPKDMPTPPTYHETNPATRRSWCWASPRTSCRSPPWTTTPKAFSRRSCRRCRASDWSASAASSSRRFESSSIRANSRQTASTWRTCGTR